MQEEPTVLSDLALTQTPAGSWSCLHYGLLRVILTPSSTLEEKPSQLRDLQSAACLGPRFPFHSTAVQGSQVPKPGVINVLLILQIPASPFDLNLIKVASQLWPACLMQEWELASLPTRACMM